MLRDPLRLPEGSQLLPPGIPRILLWAQKFHGIETFFKLSESYLFLQREGWDLFKSGV